MAFLKADAAIKRPLCVVECPLLRNRIVAFGSIAAIPIGRRLPIPLASRASPHPVHFPSSLSHDLLKLLSDQFAFGPHWRPLLYESMYLTREIRSAIFD